MGLVKHLTKDEKLAGANQELCARQKTATKDHQWQELNYTVANSAPDSCGEICGQS